MSGMPLRGDRVHRYVVAFCPTCHAEEPDRPLEDVRRLSGWLVVRDDRVWLERGCPEHGLVRTLYDESPEILSYLEEWTAPTKSHVPDVRGNFLPVPAAYAQGLPEMQTQHTCILLEDVIDHCNLRCPTCFTESSPALGAVAPLEQVLASIDTRLSRENGRLDVVMLSGGEPTLYPHLAELLDAVAARPVVRILVNTNGIRLATDDALLALLARHRERVEVYLQYDGLSADASRHHRGADLRRQKDLAVERLSAAGIFTTLTMTVALGVNDDEIGAVVKRGLDTPYVGGVTIQPVFGSGRSAGIDPLDRLTHTGVLARLEGADRRPGDLARPHRAAVLAPALLLRGLPAARRRRHLALAHLARRPRPAQGAARAAAGRRRQPDRRRRAPQGHAGGRQGLAARPAVGAVVAVAPGHRAALEGRLRELRPRHRHAAHPGRRARCRGRGSGCGSCSASGCCASPSSRSWTCRRWSRSGSSSAACTSPPSTSSPGRTSARRSARSRPGPRCPAPGSRPPPAAGPYWR